MKTLSAPLRGILFATAAFCPAGAAMAEAPAAAPSAQLEEIVVTAQRREESAQKAAVPISVITADQVRNSGVARPEQLTQLAPALQSSPGGGNTALFFVRGVGSSVVTPLADPAIAFNYDGVYIGRPSSTIGSFYDLQRVELLKGPQGTLYGRNATGGAINVIPNRPNLDTKGGYLSASAGNYDARNFEAAVNLPINANAAARLAGLFVDHSGYNSDGSDSLRGYGARLQYLWRPSENLDLRLAGDYYHSDGSGVGGYIGSVIANPDYFAFLGGATAQPRFTPAPYSLNVGLGDPRTTALLQTLYNPVAGRALGPLLAYPSLDDDFWGVNAEVNWKTSLGTLTVIPAYRRSHLNDVSTVPGFFYPQTETDKQKSLEVRFASPEAGMLRWLLGAYRFEERIGSDAAYNQYVLVAPQVTKTGTTSTAGFGRLTFAPTDSLRFVGAVRYTHEEKTFDGRGSTLLGICTVGAPPDCPNAPLIPYARNEGDVVKTLGLVGPVPVAIPGFDRVYVRPASPGTVFGVQDQILVGDRTDKKWTWRGAVEYDVAPASLLYASVETGYHGGGFSYVTDSRRTYAPETITAYTVGTKNRLFDNRLQLNLELFLWKYRNQQVSHFVVDANSGATAFVAENIGRSTNKGVEADLQYLLTPDTVIGAEIQYLHARYDSFRFSNPGLAITGCSVIGAANNPNGVNTIDCSGRQAARSPTWTINLNARQSFDLGENRIVLGASTHYQSSSFSDIDFLPAARISGYWNSNAYATLEFGESRRTSVTAFVNNIEDHRVFNGALNGLLHFISGPLSPPRTYGVRLGVEF